jgi:SAM-dependent methyltransferase
MPQAYSAAFARAYQLRWGFFATRAAPLIQAYYETTPIGKNNRKMLDLCCGTGVLAIHFLAHGYQVVGLDLSEPMLAYARQNTWEYMVADQVSYIQGDASSFQMAERFGLVVSTFDALNHLPDETALQSCFISTYAVLERHGIFIFDLNTARGLRQWNGMQVDDSNPEALIINRGFLVDENHRAWTAITGFLKEEDERYSRFDEVAYNTLFRMDRVKQLLQETGFSQIRFARLAELSTPVVDPEAESRIFILANKQL